MIQFFFNFDANFASIQTLLKTASNLFANICPKMRNMHSGAEPRKLENLLKTDSINQQKPPIV